MAALAGVLAGCGSATTGSVVGPREAPGASRPDTSVATPSFASPPMVALGPTTSTAVEPSPSALVAGAPLTASIGTAYIGPVVVGARRFADGLIVAEVYAQALSAAGIGVERQFTFDRVREAYQALVSGAIDLYPESRAAADRQILGIEPPAFDDGAAFGGRQRAYAADGLVWLDPVLFTSGTPRTEDSLDLIAPLARAEILTEYPEVETTLNAVSARLTDGAMTRLRARVQLDHREPAVAVGEWLRADVTGR
jgi:glycine betaine/choline ABC-type transport system substrate-binding protein